MRRQIICAFGRSVSHEVLGCGHQNGRNGANFSRHHALRRRAAAANAHVKPSCQQVNVLVRQLQLHADFGVGVEEAGQLRQHIAPPEAHAAIDTHEPLRLRTLTGQRMRIHKPLHAQARLRNKGAALLRK